MATASHVELDPATAGVYHAPDISSQSAQMGSQLLQENHDQYHMYFNKSGFHNHNCHLVLTLYALGASPTEIQQGYDRNKSYQRRHFPVNSSNVEEMADRAKFKTFLGKERYFHDFESFFSREVEKSGWEEVLNEHLFARDEHADDLLSRMYAGFLHPLIHLGFGIEFKQPAIIIEALAQAATHDDWVKPFLLQAEEKAKTSSKSKSLVQLLYECRENDKIRTSPHWEDGNKVRDGVLVRAPTEMIELASQWTVKPEELEQKTAEMINAAAFFTGAAQNPPKRHKIDFFYMHCLNCSIFFSALIKEPWLKVEDKCRMLEWKGRLDLALYVSRGCPELVIDEIKNYTPTRPDDSWADIIRRVNKFGDDGHASKLIRAIANGAQVTKPYEGQQSDVFPIQGDDTWLKFGHMAIDSVEGSGAEGNWVRNTGFEQAWENVAERSRL